jgi:hypothetical protein
MSGNDPPVTGWSSWLSSGLAQVGEVIRSTVESEVATLRSEHSEAQRRDSASRLPSSSASSVSQEACASSTSSSARGASTHWTSSTATSSLAGTVTPSTCSESVARSDEHTPSASTSTIATSLAKVKVTLGLTSPSSSATATSGTSTSPSTSLPSREALPPWLDFQGAPATALSAEERERMQLEILG